MKKKIISSIVALALIITSVAVLPSLYENTSNDEGDSPDVLPDAVAVNEENFPDESFRNYVLELEKAASGENAGNGIFEKEELEQVTSVMASSLGIQDLKGIEYFTYLETLNISGNGVKKLDLSHFKNLKELICSDNKLESLDLSKLTALEKIDCASNSIEELNVNDNPLLTELCVSNNPVTALDIRNNPVLQRFEASNTKLTSLNIENHTPFDSSDAENIKEFDFFELNNSSYPVFSCNAEIHDLDLTTLPGSFNIEKASEWNGAELVDTTLKGVKLGDTVTYSYDAGCGISVQFTITFEEGHDPVKVEDRTEICSTAEELWQCADCGKFFSDEEGTVSAEAVIGHSYNEGVVEKEATCTEEGVLLKSCTICGHEHREAIEMLPHTIGDSYEFDDYQHWKVCQVCGTEVDREDHSFDGDDNICLVCGETIQRHHHNIVFAEEKAPTCNEEGVKEHYYCADCETYFTDSEGIEEIAYADLIIEKLDHQYETRFDENEHWQECTLCGDKKDIQSHNFEEERTEPTCCADGAVNNICHDCGYTVEVEVLPATGDHIFAEEYSTDENSHWFSCTNEECTERYQLAEHSFTKLEIAKNPTCSEEGVLNHICEVCGYTKSEPIPVSDTHNFNDSYVQIDEHTHAKACADCGEIIGEEEPHEFDQSNVKDLGEQHASICSLCGASDQPNEHVYEIEIVKASCFEGAKLVYTCKICGHSYFEETSEPTGEHIFSEEYTLDGDKHVHSCMTEGCTAVDKHTPEKCSFTGSKETEPSGSEPVDTEPDVIDPDETVPEITVSDSPVDDSIKVDVDVTISQVSTIDIVWPTSVSVVFNPYRLKVKNDSEEHSLSFAGGSDESSETVLSGEMAFINRGDCEVKVTVTGSVTAVTSTDLYGNPLLDNKGNPITKPSENIVFVDKPLDLNNPNNADVTPRKNAILLYLEATSQFDSTGTYGIYSGIYDRDNANQMLLGSKEISKNLFNIAPNDGEKDGVTNVKICGDMETDPDVSWSEVSRTDQIKIILVFEAAPLEDADNGSSEETDGDSANQPVEETVGENTENPAESASETTEQLVP